MHPVAQPFCLLEAMGRQEDRDARSRRPSISSCTSRAATGSSPEDSWIVSSARAERDPLAQALRQTPARIARTLRKADRLERPGARPAVEDPVEAGEMKDTPSTAIRFPNCFDRPSTTIAAPPPPEATVIGVGPRR
jgi:hypothetical protein